MKSVSVFFLLVFFVSTVQAQDLEKIFVPYYVKDGVPVEFERTGAVLESKSIGFGYGGMNSYYTIFKSRHSPVQFRSGSMPTFLIKVEDGTELTELVLITRADEVSERKTYRRFVQSGESMVGSKDFSDRQLIPTFKKVEGNLYEMTFDGAIEPGEYAFMPIYRGQQAANIYTTTDKYMIYCFGVDN